MEHQNSQEPDGLHNVITGLTLESPPTQPNPPSNNTEILPEMIASSSSAVPEPATPDYSGPALSYFTPTQIARPLSTNSVPVTSSKRYSSGQAAESSRQGTRRIRRFPKAEKEGDDPSSSAEQGPPRDRIGATTPTALTRLFAVTGSSSPPRQRSFNRQSSIGYTQASFTPTPLPHHLYTRGFLDGRHSDIVIHAFGKSYPLHRIILDRAPFFSSALSEPWAESTAKEVSLHPEDLDSNITSTAFELALKRLYGSSVAEEEDAEAAGMFATACWLEMPDLVESSVESLLRQLKTSNIGDLIRLVTTNYYGQAGERLLSSAKAMLYREGWEVPLRCWDDIPAEVIREVVGGDGFFILGEWERWVLAKRVLDRRLRRISSQLATAAAVEREDDDMRDSGDATDTNTMSEDVLQATYDHPEVTPILSLLDDGIYYIHLSFEQLQHIKQQKDAFGKPALAEHVIANALWSAMELRQKIVNVGENQLELGLRNTIFRSSEKEPSSESTAGSSAKSARGISSGLGWVKLDLKPAEIGQGIGDRSECQRWLIPSLDSTSVVGESAEHGGQSILFRTSSSAHPPSHHESAWHPSDASTTTTETVPGPSSRLKPSIPSRSSSNGSATQPSYSDFPPFRFSAEFPNPRVLKERKRVYSRAVWYAGSMWNIYIQKVRSTKNTQLGVYLHRARDRDTDEFISNAVGHPVSSVDERIGHLEREMLLRRSERRARRQRQYEAQLQVSDDSGSSGADNNGQSSSSPKGGSKVKQSHQDSTLLLSSSIGREEGEGSSDADEEDEMMHFASRYTTPAMPPYVDTRPTIKTYFKIFSPSRGGRLLSVYESAPDTFNYSQSWGWKSSTLILDDGIKDLDDDDRPRDGRLRFSVVLGNV